MFSIKRTDEFSLWLDGLKDRVTRQRLNVRLRKALLGNLGDVKPVGSGVFEMREHFGPGSADIAKAIALAAILED
jgi:putative addiction module killer protein